MYSLVMSDRDYFQDFSFLELPDTFLLDNVANARPHEKLPVFEVFLRKYPAHPRILFHVAQLHAGLFDYEGALQLYQAVCTTSKPSKLFADPLTFKAYEKLPDNTYLKYTVDNLTVFVEQERRRIKQGDDKQGEKRWLPVCMAHLNKTVD